MHLAGPWPGATPLPAAFAATVPASRTLEAFSGVSKSDHTSCVSACFSLPSSSTLNKQKPAELSNSSSMATLQGRQADATVTSRDSRVERPSRRQPVLAPAAAAEPGRQSSGVSAGPSTGLNVRKGRTCRAGFPPLGCKAEGSMHRLPCIKQRLFGHMIHTEKAWGVPHLQKPAPGAAESGLVK